MAKGSGGGGRFGRARKLVPGDQLARRTGGGRLESFYTVSKVNRATVSVLTGSGARGKVSMSDLSRYVLLRRGREYPIRY